MIESYFDNFQNRKIFGFPVPVPVSNRNRKTGKKTVPEYGVYTYVFAFTHETVKYFHQNTEIVL